MILDDHTLSHAYMEHIANLLHQVFKYAMEYENRPPVIVLRGSLCVTNMSPVKFKALKHSLY